jgi:hypothetical protein
MKSQRQKWRRLTTTVVLLLVVVVVIFVVVFVLVDPIPPRDARPHLTDFTIARMHRSRSFSSLTKPARLGKVGPVD